MSCTTHTQPIAFRPDTLLASVAVLLAVNLVQRSIGFGRGVLFCRWLDPESLGHWDMAYGFLMLAAPVAVLGLPGCFGRYLERFRQRGQLRMFLVRTGLWTGTLALATVGSLCYFRESFAQLAFGDRSQGPLLVLMAVALAAIILHHFLEAVFAGLRIFRVVSLMQFIQSMLFAAISLTLLATWRNDAWSVVAGYGAGCLLSALMVLLWSTRLVADAGRDTIADSHRQFWPPLLRFAVWVWITALLSNLFTVIDRYMIVHYSGLPAEGALALVGHYHTSMLIPVLLISVANLLTGAMTPHLSHEWEAGDRQGVAARINLTLKLVALGMFAMGVGVLIVAPFLFHHAFEGKYDEGLHVLPWTLTACVWFSLLLVAQTYVWCAEKTRLATVPLAIGLVGNVALNLLLLPRLGLLGAVIATAVATLLALLVQLAVDREIGMSLSRGVVIVSLAPLGLACGLPTALASGSVLVLISLFTPWIFEPHERAGIVSISRERLARFGWPRRMIATEP